MLAELAARVTALIDRVFPPPSLPPPAAMTSHVYEAAPAQPATDAHPARGPELRSVHARDGEPKLSDGVETLTQLFARSVAKFADNKCLGWRPKKVGGRVEEEEGVGGEGS